jgi:allantoate deiminase
MADAFRSAGLDPACLGEAAYPPGRLLGYLEAHIEQGPVLEQRGAGLGVVEAIAGQSRVWVEFAGKAGHAGTSPMEGRRDALATAAELVLDAEQTARATPGLRATVGSLTVLPGAVNVVPGASRLSLDVRHPRDDVRRDALAGLLCRAREAAGRRGIAFHIDHEEHHPAVPADPCLTGLLADAVRSAGHAPTRLVSGAGHDAAVMAAVAPMALLFLRSPGGVGHHPDERVLLGDVRDALGVIVRFLERLASSEREGASVPPSTKAR